MTVQPDFDRLIETFFEDGPRVLPGSSYEAVRTAVDHTRQRVVIGPWREQQMKIGVYFAAAAAAFVLVAIVSLRFLPGLTTGPAATLAPTAVPTPAATPAPTALPAAIADPGGPLQPGTYVAHPFADSTVGFTFTVANVGWDAVRDDLGHTIGISNHGDDKLVGLGFLRVNSTNSDACHSYGTFNDEPLGPTVDDLVTSLESMYYFGSPDLASVQEPVSGSSLGGYSGRFLRIKMPDRSFEDCDDGGYRIWNADGFDIYAQGPLNRWDLDILDVDGERIVVLVSDFETTAGALRDELRRIRSSITITP